MPYIQNLKIPTQRINTFKIRDFSGGLNNVSDVKDNQASSLFNLKFISNLLMRKRNGIEPMMDGQDYYLKIPDSDPDKSITFFDEYKPYLGENKVITATDSKLYVDGVFLVDVNGRVNGTTYMGSYYFVDTEYIWVYDGTDVRKIVNPPSGFTPNPLPAVVGEWKDNDAVSPKETWYEPCQGELDDTFLGDNVVPVKPSLIATRKGRLYISGCEGDPNNVYISDLENGEYFAVTLPLQPSPNGEKVTCLYQFMDTMIIGREESIYVIYGNTNRTTLSDQFIVKHINTHAGIVNQQCVAIMHNYIVYLGHDGVIYRMITPNTDVNIVTTDVLSKTIDIFSKPLSLSKSDLKDAHAIFYDGEYMLKIGSYILIYNYTELAWTVYDLHNPTRLFDLNGKLIFGKDDGYVYKMKEDDTLETFNDKLWNGVEFEDNAITCYWSSKRYDMGDSTLYKHFREMFVVVQTYTLYNSVNKINFEIDFVDIPNILEVKEQVAVWGRAKFGERFIKKEIATSLPTQIGRRGRYITYMISNDNINQPMLVHEIAGDYILRGRR